MQEEAERPILPAAYPSVGGTEELTFRQGPEEQAAVQVGENGATQASNLQSLTAPVKPSGTREIAAPMKSSQMQASAAQRPVSPAYTELLRTFVPSLTEADLQFLSENQRTQLLEAAKQGLQIPSQRDIRVAGNGLESSLGHTQAEQTAVQADFPPVGGIEELTFRQETEEQTALQSGTSKNAASGVKPGPSKVQTSATQSGSSQTQASGVQPEPSGMQASAA